MLKLIANKFHLTWSKNSETRKLVGVTEYSDLRDWVPQGKRLLQFDLCNPTTGRTVRFEFAREVRSDDMDNELVADVFVPSMQDKLRYPHLGHVEFHILND